MKELKKQRRIRDITRVKAKAKWVFHTVMGQKWVPDCARHREALNRHLKHAEYLAVCSCNMCGNPRRVMRGRDNRSLQEIKFDLRWND